MDTTDPIQLEIPMEPDKLGIQTHKKTGPEGPLKVSGMVVALSRACTRQSSLNE